MIGRFLDEADTFHFGCQMTGDCCRHFTIYCTPYDIVRLRHATRMSTTDMLAAGMYEIVEESFSAIFGDNAAGALLALFGAEPHDIMPVAKLRKASDACGTKCVFLRADNLCGVYEHRPGVCRSYPLGRLRTPDGPRWFERQYDCPGKNQGTHSVADWIRDSGLTAYGQGNDRFAAFVDVARAAGLEFGTLPPKQRNALQSILYDFDAVTDAANLSDDDLLTWIDSAARDWLERVHPHARAAGTAPQ